MLQTKKRKYRCVNAVDLRCSFLQVVVLGASSLGSGEDTRGLDWPWVRLMGWQETLQDALNTLVKFWQYVLSGFYMSFRRNVSGGTWLLYVSVGASTGMTNTL